MSLVSPALGAVGRAGQPPPTSVRPDMFLNTLPTDPVSLYPVGSAARAAEPEEHAAAAAARPEEQAAPARAEQQPPLVDPDTDEEEEEEAKSQRMARGPSEPTKKEREEHRATHLPFRSWFPFCVAGRSDNPPHHRRPAEQDQPTVPEVHFDYAYVRRQEEDLSLIHI